MFNDCSTPVHTSYDYRLVAVSFLIAIFSSYTAIDLAGRIAVRQGRARLGWLMGGAFSMGSGVWAMHYIGMLAFRIPIPVYYHVPTVLLSLLAAVLASFVALEVIGRERVAPSQFAVGSALMGMGIATMHYTGMAAMRLPAMHHYDHALLVLSIVLAIAISFVGLLLLFRFRAGTGNWRPKFAAAIIVGLAIPITHYTGMAAVRFYRSAKTPDMRWSVDISALASSGIVVVVVVILIFAVVTSLVDRLSAQKAILGNERIRLRALIDNIPDFMYVKDLEGRFVLANRRLAEVVGVPTPDGVLGKTDFDLLPNESATAFHEREQSVIRSGAPSHYREEMIVDAAGKRAHILTTTVPLRNSQGAMTGIAVVGRDVSYLKKAEQTLRAAHQEAELFINSVPSILIGLNHDSVITRWNAAASAAFGLSSEEVLGKPLATCGIGWRWSEMEEEMRRWSSQKSRYDQITFEQDGRKRLLELTVTPVDLSGRAVFEVLLVASDVTDRTVLEEQLRQAQKLESIGQLAAGIAHEINTPMQYIGDNVQFLKDSFRELTEVFGLCARLLLAVRDDTASSQIVSEVDAVLKQSDMDLVAEIPKAIEHALEGVSRVTTLVRAMKEFSHPGKKEKTPQDLNRAIENTIAVSRNEWKYVAELDTELDPSLPPIECYLNEFKQVILNLIVNAAHAIADRVGKEGSSKGKIKVQTRNCPDYAEIRIQDNGLGIPEKIRSRIFDPFFTTKEVGKGTGQGLAIARSVVVNKHGGTIHFETEEGVGTTFIIRLPRNIKAAGALTVSV